MEPTEHKFSTMSAGIQVCEASHVQDECMSSHIIRGKHSVRNSVRIGFFYLIKSWSSSHSSNNSNRKSGLIKILCNTIPIPKWKFVHRSPTLTRADFATSKSGSPTSEGPFSKAIGILEEPIHPHHQRNAQISILKYH